MRQYFTFHLIPAPKLTLLEAVVVRNWAKISVPRRRTLARSGDVFAEITDNTGITECQPRGPLHLPQGQHAAQPHGKAVRPERPMVLRLSNSAALPAPPPHGYGGAPGFQEIDSRMPHTSLRRGLGTTV